MLLLCLMLWPVAWICTFGQLENMFKHTFAVEKCSWGFVEVIEGKMDNQDETLQHTSDVVMVHSNSVLAVNPEDEFSPSSHQVAGQLNACRLLSTLAESSLGMRELRQPKSVLIWS